MDVKGTSKTLEDILKDSDSEMEYLDEDERPKAKTKGKKRSQAWIQDDPENIVDLADVSSARKITGLYSTVANLERKWSEKFYILDTLAQ